MNLRALVGSSRHIAAIEINRLSSITVAKVVVSAVADCADMLHRRNQTMFIDRGELNGVSQMNLARLIELLADGIRDVSSLSHRGGTLSIRCLENTITITGFCAVDLHDVGLEIDKTFKLRAFLLKIGVSLDWRQGRGPELTLSLPSAKRSTTRYALTQRRSRGNNISSAGLALAQKNA